jgi:hypothetical protein
LRASELRGLRWPNVDLAKRELHVRERADEYKQLGPPKSGSGERTVPLTPMVVTVLQEWKDECPESRLDLVFPTPKGEVQGLSNIVKRGLVPAQINAGVTKEITGAHGVSINRAKYPGLHLPEREIMTGIGAVAVRQPRVRDREVGGGERIRFCPSILPPYARRTKSLEVLIPILYLKGISTGDFEDALAALLGKDAGGAVGLDHCAAERGLGRRARPLARSRPVRQTVCLRLG